MYQLFLYGGIMENDIVDIFIKSIEKRKTDFFSTGFEELDIFCKFLEGGNVMIIGGRPAMGKTNFALSIVNHLLDIKKSVMFISMEMSAERLVQRLVSEKLNIPIHNLLTGDFRKEEIEKALIDYNDKNLYINDKISVTLDDLENDIRESKPDVVFIDYIQMLEAPKAPKAPNLTEATNLAIKEVKRMAVENNVIVVLLSQLSRAVEGRFDKRPLLSDLRNGSLLEELSDVVLMLYREEYYNPEPEYPSNEIIIEKNSMGPTGIINLDFKNGFFRNQPCTSTF